MFGSRFLFYIKIKIKRVKKLLENASLVRLAACDVVRGMYDDKIQSSIFTDDYIFRQIVALLNSTRPMKWVDSGASQHIAINPRVDDGFCRHVIGELGAHNWLGSAGLLIVAEVKLAIDDNVVVVVYCAGTDEVMDRHLLLSEGVLFKDNTLMVATRTKIHDCGEYHETTHYTTCTLRENPASRKKIPVEAWNRFLGLTPIRDDYYMTKLAIEKLAEIVANPAQEMTVWKRFVLQNQVLTLLSDKVGKAFTERLLFSIFKSQLDYEEWKTEMGTFVVDKAALQKYKKLLRREIVVDERIVISCIEGVNISTVSVMETVRGARWK